MRNLEVFKKPQEYIRQIVEKLNITEGTVVSWKGSSRIFSGVVRKREEKWIVEVDKDHQFAIQDLLFSDNFKVEL